MTAFEEKYRTIIELREHLKLCSLPDHGPCIRVRFRLDRTETKNEKSVWIFSHYPPSKQQKLGNHTLFNELIISRNRNLPSPGVITCLSTPILSDFLESTRLGKFQQASQDEQTDSSGKQLQSAAARWIERLTGSVRRLHCPAGRPGQTEPRGRGFLVSWDGDTRVLKHKQIDLIQYT